MAYTTAVTVISGILYKIKQEADSDWARQKTRNRDTHKKRMPVISPNQKDVNNEEKKLQLTKVQHHKSLSLSVYGPLNPIAIKQQRTTGPLSYEAKIQLNTFLARQSLPPLHQILKLQLFARSSNTWSGCKRTTTTARLTHTTFWPGWEQVTVFGLQTGHNRLGFHFYSQICRWLCLGFNQATPAYTSTFTPKSAGDCVWASDRPQLPRLPLLLPNPHWP